MIVGGLRLAAVVAVAVIGSGCGIERPPGDATADDVTCPEAEARLGYRVCVHEIPDAELWSEISFPAEATDQIGTTTYLVPARKDARLSALFVDATAFDQPAMSLHYKFLTQAFPEFALLDYQQYVALVLPRDREWFAGSVTEYRRPEGGFVYGFTVWDHGGSLDETITCTQFHEVAAELEARIEAGPVAVVPATNLQREVLAACDVDVFDPGTALDYEIYTPGRGCGILRRYTTSEFLAATERVEFGWQDVLVTEEAPLDVETVVAGVVTGTRQGELSHLNVRSASRGTPNCYVRGAYQEYAEWEGQLVALECTPEGATIEPLSTGEARDCWDAMRPAPVVIPIANLAATEFAGLLDLPTISAQDRRRAVRRFGAKGANLATLYQRIEPELQLQGFLIPFHYYQSFVETNGWTVDLGSGEETLSYAATLDRWLDDAEFLTNGLVRRDRLNALQESMRAAPCDAELIAAIGAEIVDVFGADDVMVRLRSSSNAEDSLDFNGAGLYESTSACLADETDADVVGPSHCDLDQSGERGLCRGIGTVYASLWGTRAYEEREWYGIDHRAVAMGILVDTRSKDERANIVAFTGNPLLEDDDRFLVNAQLGELDVVSSEPGVWPEKVLLTLEAGAVTGIERARGSTEVPAGQWVLDDRRLEELGSALSEIDALYPVDEAPAPPARVLLDTEWKVLSDGRLIVKQVRPFVP